jgi:hypothetical protein
MIGIVFLYVYNERLRSMMLILMMVVWNARDNMLYIIPNNALNIIRFLVAELIITVRGNLKPPPFICFFFTILVMEC